MPKYTRICRPMRRCMDWRNCEYCARSRQATMAWRAELLEKQFDTLFLSVLTPVDKTESAIHRIRSSLLRTAFAPAGIWSVETGEKVGGLHLNVIAPQPITRNFQDCATWSQAITTGARAAAAYINKQAGFPDRAEYSGHISGSWSRIPDFFTVRQMPPAVMAASAEAALSNKHPDEYLRAALASRENPPQKADLTREDYHRIARANLPNLYAALKNSPPDPECPF